ncbi:hypothetical protein LIER_17467 [Lithospermum erythrorhizon]|uniref:Uncharacterized protein n=1 Tax=Lithospermum erythrorhizon TaxID=34254 RepID=A0AAV3QEJ0_LITER
MRTLLNEDSEIAQYSCRTSPATCRAYNCGDFRYTFTSRKEFSHCVVHVNSLLFFFSLKKGKLRSPAQDMNQVKAPILLVNRYATVCVCGHCMAYTTAILLGLGSIPLGLIM